MELCGSRAGNTKQNQCGSGRNGNEVVFHNPPPRAPELDPNYQIEFSVIHRRSFQRVLPPTSRKNKTRESSHMPPGCVSRCTDQLVWLVRMVFVTLFPTNVLHMTLNNLMVRFLWCWSFGECGALLHCHRSQVRSLLKSSCLRGPYLMVKWN